MIFIKDLDIIFNKGPLPVNGSWVTPGDANYSFNNPFFVTRLVFGDMV